MSASLDIPASAVAHLNSHFEEYVRSSPDAVRSGQTVNLDAWLERRLASGPAPPSLNAVRPDELADGELIQFVGMVQDVHDPEFYDGAYETVHADGATHLCTTKYQGAIAETAGTTLRGRDDVVWQRTPVVCVPLPSRTSWLQQRLAKPVAEAKGSPVAPTGAAAAADPVTETVSSGRSKRAADDDEDMTEAAADEDGASKRLQTEGSATGGGAPACHDDPLETPRGAFARAGAGGVLLKVYDLAERGVEELKVHELVMVYGLIERASDEPDAMADVSDYHAAGAAVCEPCGQPASGSAGAAGGAGYGRHPMEAYGANERRQRPPPSAQPRVHVLAVHRPADVQSLYLPAPSTAEESLALDGARAHLPAVRTAVVGGLTACLGGDALAAEHVLLAILSRVLSRHGDVPIGKLPLYITGCPPPAAGAALSPVAHSLSSALSQLLPLCGAHALTISALNKGNFAPKKDLDANCIWPAALQLPPGSCVVVDEASLEEGKLDQGGLTALGCVRALAERQLIPYDFTYCKVDFPVDASLIAVAAGSGTMLPIATKLPLRVAAAPTTEAEALSLADGSVPWLDAARIYLGLATRLQFRQEGMAGGALAAAAEEDFVAARQADKTTSPEDLGRWLTLSRLVAASALSPTVEIEHYREARRMDTERLERLRAKDVTL